jgi:hypothetical protein
MTPDDEPANGPPRTLTAMTETLRRLLSRHLSGPLHEGALIVAARYFLADYTFGTDEADWPNEVFGYLYIAYDAIRFALSES